MVLFLVQLLRHPPAPAGHLNQTRICCCVPPPTGNSPWTSSSCFLQQIWKKPGVNAPDHWSRSWLPSQLVLSRFSLQCPGTAPLASVAPGKPSCVSQRQSPPAPPQPWAAIRILETAPWESHSHCASSCMGRWVELIGPEPTTLYVNISPAKFCQETF